MPRYTDWSWSAPHNRHYCYLLDDDGRTILDTLWSGPPDPNTGQESSQFGTSTQTTHPFNDRARVHADTATSNNQAGQQYNQNQRTEDENSSLDQSMSAAQTLDHAPYTTQSNHTQYTSPYDTLSQRADRNTVTLVQPPESSSVVLPVDRRTVHATANQLDTERLDPRFRRVAPSSQGQFFVLGRVFKMLWSEPAGSAPPSKTRNSSHFSATWLGEHVYSEIRRFVVVKNKRGYSFCLPIHTYAGRGATKKGLSMEDHGAIHTSENPPPLLAGENITKYAIRVIPIANECLAPESRVNYGKPYPVEHNVKVAEIGMVIEDHRYLIEHYFEAAIRGY